MKKIISIFLFLGISSFLFGQGKKEVTTVYLFRHAEAVFPPYDPDRPDPHLNDAGRERARLLAKMLRSEKLTHIFSSDYHRTRETVSPLAEWQKLEVTSYDPRELENFAKKIKKLKGKIAISGHSNTTPRMVELLGGEPGEPIDEKAEFGRFYILQIPPKGKVQTLVLHYGASYQLLPEH